MSENGGLSDVRFRYTPGGDVQAVWRKYGWVPPSEYRDDYLFKTNREARQDDEA